MRRVPCAALREANVRDWSSVQRVDYRPDKRLIKVTVADDEEIQLHAASGRVLQVARRRSDFIEALHDGAWLGGVIKRCVFLPAGLCLVLLWGTGVHIFVAPRWKRRHWATQGRPRA